MTGLTPLETLAMRAQLARALAGAFLVLQVVLLLECVYATSEWLTDHPGPWRMAALIAVRAHLHLCKGQRKVRVGQGVGPVFNSWLGS